MKIVWGRSIGWNITHNQIRKAMDYTVITDGVDCHPWHEVFAYWPVKTISGKTIWWKKVFKRKVWVVWGTGFHMEPETQYGTVFDLIEYENAR